jgi:hypothetical protein
LSGSLSTPSAKGTFVGTDFDSIASVLVTSAVTDIDFTSIPNTYKHLQIRGIGRVTTGTTGQSDGLIRVGSSNTIDTSSIYSRFNMAGYVSDSSTDQDVNKSSGFVWVLPRNGEGAQEYYPVLIDILDYADTNKKKTIRFFTGGSFADSNSIIYFGGILYDSTNAINCIRLFSTSTQFSINTEVALFGIKG